MAKPNIGQLNGRWASLLQLHLALAPVFVSAIIAWAGWITVVTVTIKTVVEHNTTEIAKLQMKLEPRGQAGELGR